MTEPKSEKTEKAINAITKKVFLNFCKKTCSKQYYKNQYLEYAIKNNHSLQCISRDYARFLYFGSSLTKRESDLYHSNNILNYLHNYVDFKGKQYITSLLNQFLDEVEQENDFIILFCSGRKKGFRSFEAKNRYILLMQSVYSYILENSKTFKEFNELNSIEQETFLLHFANLLEMNDEKDPTSDLNGYRLIVDQISKQCTEEDRILFCYTLKKNLISFFKRHGFVISHEKDYIKNKKYDTGYQSLHLKITILGTPIEIQIRTSSMHYEAEYGTANHDKIYKDTILQNFLKDFMYELSENSSRVSNENNGLLHSTLLMRRTISKTHDSEIPKTPEDFQLFENMKLLEKMTRKI